MRCTFYLLLLFVASSVCAQQPDLAVGKHRFIDVPSNNSYDKRCCNPVPQALSGKYDLEGVRDRHLTTAAGYLSIVEITNKGDGRAPEKLSFLVSTVCIRDGNSYILGSGRVAVGAPAPSIWAAYVIFPSIAGEGEFDCEIEVHVDVLNEIAEAIERNNVSHHGKWHIVPPGKW